jgi:hypothetical protein
MNIKQFGASFVGSLAALSVLVTGVAHAQTALSVSCTGTPGTTSIVWASNASGGVAPYVYAWGNGSTSSSQTVSATPGTYSMTLQLTDASSTVATGTCNTIVKAPATTTPVAAQLKALLDQIAALKAQIANLLLSSAGGSGSGSGTATTTPGNPRFCLNGERELRRGDRGDDVRELQRMLAADPTLYPEALITGVFGEKTEKALKQFQKKFGTSTTTQNGALDRLTRDLFRKHCGKGLVQVGTSTTTVGVPFGIFKKDHEDSDDDHPGESNRRGRDH